LRQIQIGKVPVGKWQIGKSVSIQLIGVSYESARGYTSTLLDQFFTINLFRYELAAIRICDVI